MIMGFSSQLNVHWASYRSLHLKYVAYTINVIIATAAT